MMTLLAIAALMAPPEEPAFRYTRVAIVGVGEAPPVGSGVIHVTRLILGRADDGVVEPYYLTWLGEQTPTPPLGSNCVLRHRRGVLEAVGGLEVQPLQQGQIVADFDCGPAPTRDEMIRRNRQP